MMLSSAPSSSSAAAAAGLTRRPNVPPHIRDWIYSKACLFRYYDEGVRTKEEKQLFLTQLAKKLNERYESETGAWDEARTGTQVRNLKKERASAAPPPPPGVVADAVASSSSPRFEQLLLDWQATLIAASRLNGNTLARHSSNRGACNEDLLRGFLASMLSSRYVGVGCGEVLLAGTAPPRQVDVVLYNTEYPCLQPARFGGGGGIGASSNCACFYRESIMAVIEVKTTLTNQDLRDVAAAASLLSPLPFLVFAFDSQTSLKAIDLTVLPANVVGVYTLSHGSVIASRGSDSWQAVHPSKRAPLAAFYRSLLGVLSRYGGLPPLQRVVEVMQQHLGQPMLVEEDVTSDAGSAPVEEETTGLCAIDLSRLSVREEAPVREQHSGVSS